MPADVFYCQKQQIWPFRKCQGQFFPHCQSFRPRFSFENSSALFDRRRKPKANYPPPNRYLPKLVIGCPWDLLLCSSLLLFLLHSYRCCCLSVWFVVLLVVVAILSVCCWCLPVSWVEAQDRVSLPSWISLLRAQFIVAVDIVDVSSWGQMYPKYCFLTIAQWFQGHPTSHFLKIIKIYHGHKINKKLAFFGAISLPAGKFLSVPHSQHKQTKNSVCQQGGVEVSQPASINNKLIHSYVKIGVAKGLRSTLHWGGKKGN